MMRQCTSRGRVVYERPKHLWTVKDCRRILPAAGVKNYPLPAAGARTIEQKLIEVYEVLLNNPDEPITFGGGLFGGGGAFRTFGQNHADPDRGIAFIIED